MREKSSLSIALNSLELFSSIGEISHFSKQVLLTPFQENVIGMWVGCLGPVSYLETRFRKSEFSEVT